MEEFIRFPNKEIGPVLGGPAAYSSISASRLGIKTALVTVVGREVPEYLVRPLIEAGVDTVGLRVKDCETRANILTYDAQGGKSAHFEKVASPILATDIPPEYLLAPAFLVCPMDFEVPLDTVEQLKQTGSLLMADLGGYGGAVSTQHPTDDEPEYRRLVRQLVANFDIVKASSEDIRYLLPGVTAPDRCARVFVEWGAKMAIITMGESGSLIWTGEDEHVVPAFPAIVSDVTGAGDVYSGAFLADLGRQGNVYEAALYGSAAAALLIEKSGGPSLARMPSDQDVRERLRLYSGRPSA